MDNKDSNEDDYIAFNKALIDYHLERMRYSYVEVISIKDIDLICKLKPILTYSSTNGDSLRRLLNRSNGKVYVYLSSDGACSLKHPDDRYYSKLSLITVCFLLGVNPL